MLIIKDIAQLLFSRHCITCKQPIERHNQSQQWFCAACFSDLPITINACPVCSIETKQDTICGICLAKPPWYDQTISACYYTPQIVQIIYQFKYHHQFYLHKGLTDILIAKIRSLATDLPDLICPIPLHTKRLRQRGYNHSQLIASYVSNKLQIPCDRQLVYRTHYAQPQINLSAKQRANAVKNAFAANNAGHLNHVALIDDVATTGHTVDEATKALKKQGVKKVSVWILAKTSAHLAH